MIIEQINKDSDIRTLLKAVKSLREFEGDEDSFWKNYLHAVSLLVKSPCAILLKLDEDNNQFEVSSHYGIQKEYEDNFNEIVNNTVDISTRVIENNFAYEKFRVKWINESQMFLLSFLIEGDEKFIVSVLIKNNNNKQFGDLVLRTQLISDIYNSYLRNKIKNNLQVNDYTPDNFKIEYLNNVLEVVSIMTEQDKFLLAVMTLVNDLAIRFKVSPVSFGYLETHYVKTIAISHLEKFEKNTTIIQRLESVFEEAYDQNKDIVFPYKEEDGVITDAHNRYMKEKQLSQIISLPLRIKDEPVAVIIFERNFGEFSDDELISLRLIINQITPILETLHKEDLSILNKIKLKIKNYASWWLGVEHVFTKLSVITLSLVFMYTLMFSWEYKIESTASLTTNDVQVISAPFNGIVSEVNVYEGDKIKKGKELLTFDTEELYLQLTEAQANVIKYNAEIQKTRAMNKLADMNIADAKLQQAKAKLDKIQYYIRQSQIISPVDGVIVQGDRENLLGAPVAKGDKLFQISKLTNLYLTINVNEESIDEINAGDVGELILLSRPDEKIKFILEKIIPMANIDGKQTNSFMVKAKFTDELHDWYRPGMSGVAKIHVGEKPVFWILTHKITDFFRLYFWI